MDLTQYHRADFQQFVQDHLQEDPALLLFRYQGKTDFDLKAAVQQIAARQKTAKKLPSWSSHSQLIFPPAISLEQSSSETTAELKAKGQSGRLMIDLTGGFGVDAFYLSKNFGSAIYCEQQEELAEIAQHNLDLLTSGKFKFVKGDGLAYLADFPEHFDLIYADPARRGTGNQKMYKLQDCEPDVVSKWEMMKGKADAILLKVSPMLDISQALAELPEIQVVQVVSVKNEVKELLLHWNRHSPRRSVCIEAIDLGLKESSFTFSLEEEEKAISKIGMPEKYLIEPLSAVLKAGAFRTFGERFGLKKLDVNSHLYTSSTKPTQIPGRIFEVIDEIQPKKGVVKKLFPSHKVNVITRNYATGSSALKEKLGVKDGGEEFLIGTKSTAGYTVFWCRLCN